MILIIQSNILFQDEKKNVKRLKRNDKKNRDIFVG